VDARADVFAFGAVLYEYISGTHPFAGATPLATIARVLESEARPLASLCPHVPAAILECVERCLEKTPDRRFRSAADIVRALERLDEAAGSGASPHGTRWWRIHQVVVVALYLVAAVLAWEIKELTQLPATVSLFIAVGAGGAIGGVLRGHLVFTERVNPRNLHRERRRAATALVVVDVMMALALAADAMLLGTRPLTAVLTMALGIGIALAALVVEPATTRAALGDG
jgi:hypothetical protein